jgi:hypothetical protein
MPDYGPVVMPGWTWNSRAAATITGGDPLEVAGSGTVQPVNVATLRYVGIAAHDAFTGQQVTVISARPIFDGPADGPITAGDALHASATPGRQVATAPAVSGGANANLNDLNNTRAIIGTALTTAADGQLCRWQMQ